MNGILDMWREVDQIVDSRFPAEVLKRFGNIDGAAELERGVSGYTSDEESDAEGEDFSAGRRRGSLVSRTASGLFSGLWFGKDAAKKRGGVHDEESNLLSSDSGMVSSPRRSSRSARGYGATPSALATSFSGPQGLHTIEAGVEVPPGEGLPEHSGKPDKAGVVRSRTPKGVRPAALEHVPKQKRIAALNGSRKDGNGSSGGGDADSETEDDESEVDGSLDRKLAVQRAERKARDRERIVHIPGGPDLRIERSTSSGPGKAPSEAGSNTSAKLASVPGGLRERERRKLLAHVPGKAERDDEEEKKASFAINSESQAPQLSASLLIRAFFFQSTCRSPLQCCGVRSLLTFSPVRSTCSCSAARASPCCRPTPSRYWPALSTRRSTCSPRLSSSGRRWPSRTSHGARGMRIRLAGNASR
jgi:hypothetical protein